MLKIQNFLSVFVLLLLVSDWCYTKDVLLEFKAAGFLPTNNCVKNIYGKAGCLFGPEVTFQFSENQHWYGFASVDFLSKKGCSIGLATPTKMNLVPMALGLKYFVPFNYGDFYLGLGFQPLYLKTINCSNFVAQTTGKWGLGGIAKIGTYFNLPSNFFIDLFVDYSFVTVGCDFCAQSLRTVPLKVNMNGAILGIGFGYRFN